MAREAGLARLTLRLLGGFHVQMTSGAVVPLPTRKAQALLAYLALPPGRAHPRDKLAALLWGDMRQPQARSGLRQALFALRKVLNTTDPPGLRLEGGTVALDPAAIAVDVAAFEQQATTRNPDDLARAVALYQGDLLAGLSVREAPFEDWLSFERERWREMALETMARLLAHQRSARTPEAAIQTALRLLALDPLQEPVHRALMRLFASLGRRGAALRQYQLCVDALQRELGAAPEDATRQLYQEILRERPARPATISVELTQRGAEHLPRDTPLIGRATEMARLREAVESASLGKGRLVAVVGEAGIGKSRLVSEICVEAADRGIRVLVGRSYEAERILAFGVWVDALRAARLGDDPELLDALGPTWRAELARLLPELVAPGSPPTTGSTDYRWLFESVARLVERLAARQPLLVVLEDLHWADDISVRLLAFLGRRLSTWSVVVLVTAREEDLVEAPTLRRTLEDLAREGAIAIALGRLSRDETLALVRTLSRAAGADSALASLGERVWVASEGNPFMVVETVRALDESDGSPPLARALLPDRVRAVIERRLDRLSGPAQELVAVAAVISHEFDFALLHHASGLGEAAAAALVEELVRHRILHGLGERFDFTHDRIRETVYRGLLEPRRKLLHRKVAEAIETLHAGDIEPYHVTLGLHYREGERWDKAAAYLRRAGLAAAARAAHREAVACFEQALLALERLPASAPTHAEAVDLRFDLRNSLFPLGEDERLYEHLRAAERLAEGLHDSRRLAWASSYMSNYFWRTTDYRRALEAAQRALAIAATRDDRRLEVATNLRLGQAYISTGDYRQAATALRKSVASLGGEMAHERFGLAGLPAAFSRAFLAWALAELGEFAEAIAVAEESTRIAEAARQPYSVAVSDYTLGRSYLRKGDLARAIAVLEAGWKRCREAELPANADHLAGSLGYAYALAGRAREGLPLLELAVREAESTSRHFHSLSVVWLGEAHLLTGHPEAARLLGEQGLHLSSERHERGNEAYALRLLGEAAAHERADGTGEDYQLRALTLAEELGMRPLAAHCHMGLAALQRRTGRPREAADHATAVAALFRELGMSPWQESVELELPRRS